MLEIFIAVIAGIIVGAVLIKFWRYILEFIILLINAILFILTLPINIVVTAFSSGNLNTIIVRNYQRLFNKDDNKREVERRKKKIRTTETILRQHVEKLQHKKAIELLNECKWVI